ncbi:hypothetical protein ACIHDR_48195 [Nocardia sp. NPDC052278]|uniref:hypothetical protein n=1 Tax=unclassified Nocardia TaxID=2637762 RepID=UPI0036CA9C71
MRQTLNLPTALVRLRDIVDDHVILSTDGHRVRLLLCVDDDPETVYQYADLGPCAADALAAALASIFRRAFGPA